MVQSPSPRTTPQLPSVNAFEALPAEVVGRLGHYLSKTDRHSLMRAIPRLQHAAAPVYKDDTLYDYLVPKYLQEDVQNVARTKYGSRLGEATWTRLAHRLNRDIEARSNNPAVPYLQANQVGAVTRTARRDIQTIVPLRETAEILAIGRMPSEAERQQNVQRQGRVFALTPNSQVPGRRGSDGGQALWQGQEIAISQQWRQPKTLVTAGCGGLMACLSSEDDLRLWQYEDQALAPIVFINPDFYIKATQVAFSHWRSRCHAVFFGRFAHDLRDAPIDDDGAMVHGINFCPEGAISDTKYLTLVSGAPSPAVPLTPRHLGVDDGDHTALIVGENGEVVSGALPFAGFPPAKSQVVAKRSVVHASVSALGNAVALQDAAGGVRVLRKRHALLRLVWHAPNQWAIKKMALNADGSRLGLLGTDNRLDVWSMVPEPPSTKRARGKLVCRISFEGQTIIDFDFSPYCHALLLTLPEATRLVFPLRKPVVVELPHLRGTGVFMQALRVVGVSNSALVDVDLSVPAAAAQAH